MSHTPGPWTPDRDPRMGMEWNVHILDQRGHAICFMAHSDGASPERDEANAALVAAAPDLLDALHVFAERSSSEMLTGCESSCGRSGTQACRRMMRQSMRRAR